MVNRVQSLLLNYLTALLHSGDFTLVYYQIGLGELEYILISRDDIMQKSELLYIHTLQLNILFSDWLFSKYAECIENVHCTPRTAPRLREVLLVRDRTPERHIDWSIFFTG